MCEGSRSMFPAVEWHRLSLSPSVLNGLAFPILVVLLLPI